MRKPQTCLFYPASRLVPKNWVAWFWELISEHAPFSWGDNNRSMVTADDFARHCEERLIDTEEVPPCAVREWLKKIRRLGQTYIDLEN